MTVVTSLLGGKRSVHDYNENCDVIFRYQNTFFHIIHISLNLREAKNKSNIINFATGDPEGLPVAQSGWFESF